MLGKTSINQQGGLHLIYQMHRYGVLRCLRHVHTEGDDLICVSS